MPLLLMLLGLAVLVVRWRCWLVDIHGDALFVNVAPLASPNPAV